jgi:hypothetical protein
MKKIIIGVLCVLICFTMIAALSSCAEKETEKGNDAELYTVKYKGVSIKLGADAKGILDKLGEAMSVSELGDCGGFGAQVKYTYGDVAVYTLKNDEGETVDQIDLKSDLVSTSKGISIGATADEVTAAYGEPNEKSDKDMRYIDGNNVIKFKLEGGSVKDISIMRITK